MSAPKDPSTPPGHGVQDDGPHGRRTPPGSTASGSRPPSRPDAASSAGATSAAGAERGRVGSQPPPSSQGGGRHSRPPREPHEDRSAFDRILPELLKRGLEASRGTIGNVSDTLFSRDVAAGLVSQLGEMREGVVSAVAQEVGRFLRQADIAAEVRNVLTGMEVEANVKIKFRKSEKGGVTTEVEVEDPPRRGKR